MMIPRYMNQLIYEKKINEKEMVINQVVLKKMVRFLGGKYLFRLSAYVIKNC